LRHALSRGELALYYQPQVDLDSGEIFAAEALLRWCRPQGEPISCGAFIAAAEETGLILQIGDWALRQACEQLKRWHDAGHEGLRIAVNLSARQFYQPGLLDRLARHLNETGLAPASLDLEITESILLQPTDDNFQTLQRIEALGVGLSVDDFGTGYSSLAYLQRFPIHGLKIDRSFIDGVDEDPSDAAIVTAIIAMAQSLHLEIVAEGVENEGQIRFLQARGCRLGQGYYYSPAVPANVFDQLLQCQAAQQHAFSHLHQREQPTHH